MIDLTPSHCEFKSCTHSKSGLVRGLIAAVDPDILAFEHQICVRRSLANFSKMTDEKLIISFPEIKRINTAINKVGWPDASFDEVGFEEYDADLVQPFHKDNKNDEQKPFACFLERHRDLETIVIDDDFFYSNEYQEIASRFSSNKKLHQYLVRKGLASTVNSNPGLNFISDKNTHHARTCLGARKIDLSKQPTLHCYDLI